MGLFRRETNLNLEQIMFTAYFVLYYKCSYFLLIRKILKYSLSFQIHACYIIIFRLNSADYMSFSERLRMKFTITVSHLITPVCHLGYPCFCTNLSFSYQMYCFEEEFSFLKITVLPICINAQNYSEYYFLTNCLVL